MLALNGSRLSGLVDLVGLRNAVEAVKLEAAIEQRSFGYDPLEKEPRKIFGTK